MEDLKDDLHKNTKLKHNKGDKTDVSKGGNKSN